MTRTIEENEVGFPEIGISTFEPTIGVCLRHGDYKTYVSDKEVGECPKCAAERRAAAED